MSKNKHSTHNNLNFSITSSQGYSNVCLHTVHRAHMGFHTCGKPFFRVTGLFELIMTSPSPYHIQFSLVVCISFFEAELQVTFKIQYVEYKGAF